MNDPVNDPLIVWFNGGPGCSSLSGLLAEYGPFFVNRYGTSLFENVYTWNKAANMLFLGMRQFGPDFLNIIIYI